MRRLRCYARNERAVTVGGRNWKIFIVACIVTGCSANMTAARPAAVRVLDAEVAVEQFPQSLSFVVTAVIRNSSRSVPIRRTCGTRVEKLSGNLWTTAYAEICVSGAGVGAEAIAPGDSATERIRVSGYTSPLHLPRFDFGDSLAGEYRLWLTFRDVRMGDPSPRILEAASNSFRLR